MQDEREKSKTLLAPEYHWGNNGKHEKEKTGDCYRGRLKQHCRHESGQGSCSQRK